MFIPFDDKDRWIHVLFYFSGAETFWGQNLVVSSYNWCHGELFPYCKTGHGQNLVVYIFHRVSCLFLWECLHSMWTIFIKVLYMLIWFNILMKDYWIIKTSYSMILQIRRGRKPDGVCLVVGTCGRGFKNNSISDVIFSSSTVKKVGGSKAQYFWEVALYYINWNIISSIF